MLVCTRCNQTKDESQFFKNKRYASGYMTWCKACHREYYRQPEQKEKAKTLVRAWYERHMQKVKEYNRKWHQGNIERRHKINNARFRERYANDQEFRKRKNDYKSHFNHKRREQMKSEFATLTQKEWESLCTKYEYRCLCCRKRKPLTIDHIVPLSKGGIHSVDNVQPLCKSCNSKKMTKIIDYRVNWE